MRPVFRPATFDDLKTLVELENECFTMDRLSLSSFRHFLRTETSDLFVVISQKILVGYYLLLFRQGTALARLYSIAISPQMRGQGLGRSLMNHAIEQTRLRNKSYLRLEVRPDNNTAIALYQSLGFKKFSTKPHFYEDDSDALVLEKHLIPRELGLQYDVPYYPQSLEFSCGPACLLMAMAAFSKKVRPSLKDELQIWRESTTIFMTSGHGGCGPLGLALAAKHRGFPCEVWITEEGPHFTDGVRTQKKKDVISLVYQDFREQIKSANIPLKIRPLKIGDLERQASKGGVSLVLISAYRIASSKAPHWVTIAGFDRHCYYIHDPDLGNPPRNTFEASLSKPDFAFIPVKKADFIKMSRYGKRALQMVVTVFPKK
jgi:ribosomal-protein-alanine acetyltransferase